MKKNRLLRIGVLMVGMLGYLMIAPANSEVVDRIVAILNDELVLLSEVREYAMRPATRVVANLQAGATLEEDTLHYIIERQLLAHEVEYLAVPREIDVVKALAIRYIAATYHYQDSQALLTAAQAAGVTEGELENELMLYMKGVDYIRRKYRFSEDVDNTETVFTLFTNWLAELKTQATIQLLF